MSGKIVTAKSNEEKQKIEESIKKSGNIPITNTAKSSIRIKGSEAKEVVEEKASNTTENIQTRSFSLVLKDISKVLENAQFKNFEKFEFESKENVSPPISQQNQSVKMKQKRCDTCSRIFTGSKEFDSHKCIYKCEFCDSKFSYITRVLAHRKKKHQNEIKALNIKCYFCNEFFFLKSSSYLHMNNEHFVRKSEQFECDFCGRSFKSRRILFCHMKLHLSKVSCSVCNAKLAPLSLYQHMTNFHAERNQFQCRICSKAFKSQKKLFRHEKIHDKKIECKLCSHKFITIWWHDKHMKESHLNTKSYSCEMCDKKFSRKQSLKKHQRIHDRNRPKPFKCQRCAYACDTNHYYQKHIKSHQRQDEKFMAMKNPVKCEKCPTFCRNKTARLNHMIKVHPKEPFQCDLCGCYIKVKCSLKTHIKLHIKIRMKQLED